MLTALAVIFVAVLTFYVVCTTVVLLTTWIMGWPS
jgi:hypothetical protein